MSKLNASASCLQRVDFDLDFDHVASRRPCALDCRPDAARDREVVVLDENAVVEAEAMVRPAARAHGVFLDRAQAGKRLADVDDARLRATHGLDDPRGGRGDAAHVADKVERDALGREQAARRGTFERPLIASPAATWEPSTRMTEATIAGSMRTEGHEREIEAGVDGGLARGERYLGAHVARHDGVRGDVAGAAEILEQCRADDRFDED